VLTGSAASRIAVLVAVLVLTPAVSHAETLLWDDFGDPGFDPEWTVHGDGVTNAGGEAMIVCDYHWSDGLESNQLFNRPPAGVFLLVQGTFRMDEQSPRSAGAVQLADPWDDPWDSYRIQFAKDYQSAGDNVVFFKSWIAGVEQETLIGVFEPGVSIEWMFCLDVVGCEVWLDPGTGWELVHTEPLGDFDCRVNLHGSGDTGGGGGPNTSYWDNILVHTETACPVAPTSWSHIKAMFR